MFPCVGNIGSFPYLFEPTLLDPAFHLVKVMEVTFILDNSIKYILLFHMITD